MRAGVTFRYEAKVVPYERALREVGIESVRISPAAPQSLESIDGLVLTGGTDINPARYAQDRAPETGDRDDPRDELEIRLLRDALAAELPVLAICRGMQLLNVACGGTLIQHLPSTEIHIVKPREAAAHIVYVTGGARLIAIIGEGEHEVNSRHHQAVDRPGDGLIVSAKSPDGVIEAIERPGESFVLGVQWHPEDRILISADDRKLFEAFASALRARAIPLSSSPAYRRPPLARTSP